MRVQQKRWPHLRDIVDEGNSEIMPIWETGGSEEVGVISLSVLNEFS